MSWLGLWSSTGRALALGVAILLGLAGASALVGGEGRCPRSTNRRRAMCAPAAAR